MEHLISFDNFNLQTLCNALADAAIDFRPHDDKTVYVTGYAFPCFWRIDARRHLLIYYTFIDADSSTADAEFCDFANACNRRLMMVQFSFQAEDDGERRIYGHYVISLKDGVNLRQALRSGRIFAEVFDDAASDGIAQGILIPLSASGGRTNHPSELVTTH